MTLQITEPYDALQMIGKRRTYGFEMARKFKFLCKMKYSRKHEASENRHHRANSEVDHLPTQKIADSVSDCNVHSRMCSAHLGIRF